MRRTIILITAAIALGSVGGCGMSNAQYMTEQRLDNGLVVILPGIEGESPMNHDIRRGLVAAGVPAALPIHSWGRPVPIAGVLLNQMDFIGNRLEGAKLARMVVEYQDAHPGRPVYLVGHSGGGGVAVFAAEAMPEGRQVDGLVLLSASISREYDVTKALQHCRQGIVNFYNRSDAGLLGVGTTVVGNVDGRRGPSAGLSGFAAAPPKLYQVEVTGGMGGDPHAAATRSGFVSRRVAPWIVADAWPAYGGLASRR